MKLITLGVAFAGVLAASVSAQALEKVKFGTNWIAQPEHGGFYQSVADGTYEKCGLDVEIVPGGPNVNNRALLLAGKLDFYMDGNLLQPFNSIKEGIPVKVVASMFQKEPQIFMTHPGQGLDTWESLKTIDNIMIGNGGYHSFFLWMKSIGFKDEQRKPYTFNSAPFLADKKSAQQGYVTSEPFAIMKEGGFEPNVFLLADYGFETYSTLIDAMANTVKDRPETVKCFVEGSILGWTNYMYGDGSAANKLIQTHNPDMSDEQIKFSVAQLKKFGIVDSGDSETMGIGAMSADRIKRFYDDMVKAGVVDAGIDVTKVYDLSYINKGLGVDIKKKLMSQ